MQTVKTVGKIHGQSPAFVSFINCSVLSFMVALLSSDCGVFCGEKIRSRLTGLALLGAGERLARFSWPQG